LNLSHGAWLKTTHETAVKRAQSSPVKTLKFFVEFYERGIEQGTRRDQ
jgi:hypothetical protein